MTRGLSILTIVFLTTLSILTYSQDADTSKAKRLIIKASLLEYVPTFSLNTGNFNIGTEIYLKNRKSLSINVGIIKSYGQVGGIWRIPAISTQGIKIQVEGKHYLNRHKIFEPAFILFWPHIFQYNSQTRLNTGYYIAAHSFYQFTATDREETVVDYFDPYILGMAHLKQNIYTVDRNIYGLNIKIGYQCIKKCGVTIDYSFGLGGQYIISNSKEKLGTDYDLEFPGNKPFDKGKGLYPNLIYQMQLGWGL